MKNFTRENIQLLVSKLQQRFEEEGKIVNRIEVQQDPFYGEITVSLLVNGLFDTYVLHKEATADGGVPTFTRMYYGD